MMNKLFRKKLTRGGFTLAELLIVVAIIAILVAIAMPIFVNGLNEAKYRTVQADARDIRAAAVEEILTHWNDNDASGKTKYAKGANGTGTGWWAFAYVDTAGHISGLQVYVKESGVTEEKSWVRVLDKTDYNLYSTSFDIAVSDKDKVLDLDTVTEGTYYAFKIQIMALGTADSVSP